LTYLHLSATFSGLQHQCADVLSCIEVQAAFGELRSRTAAT